MVLSRPVVMRRLCWADGVDKMMYSGLTQNKKLNSVHLRTERGFGPSPPISNFHKPLDTTHGLLLIQMFCREDSQRICADVLLFTLGKPHVCSCYPPLSADVRMGLTSQRLFWECCFASAVLNELLVLHHFTTAVFLKHSF